MSGYTPPVGTPVREIVGTLWSPWTLGPMLDFFEAGDGGGTSSWPTANKSFLIPCHLTSDVVVKRLWARNGTSAAGNFDIGIYDANGAALLVSTGSTAMSGTSVIQAVDVTDTYLAAGNYYLAMSQSTVTNSNYLRATTTVINQKHMGILSPTSNFPLAANPTLAVASSAYVPLFGFSQRSDLPA